MSIFVEQTVGVGDGLREEELSWHPRHPLLAVAAFSESSGGDVSVFQDDGRAASSAGALRRPQRASVLAWHPEKKILAAGWANGHLSFWNLADETDPVTIAATAGTEIQYLLWSSNGFRVFLADSVGVVMEYKVDHRGAPHSSAFAKIELGQPVCAVLLRPPPAVKDSRPTDARVSRIGPVQLDNGDALDMFTRSKGGHEAFFVNIGSQESATFFVATHDGGLHILRESGTISEGPRLGRAALKLLYYTERNVLIVISEDLMLHQFSVSNDATLQPIIQVKLNEKLAHFQATWTRPAVLGMASGEARVRLWDVEREENGLLQLSTAKGFRPSDSIRALAWSKHKGLLAAATAEGRLALWRYVGAQPSQPDDEDMHLRWSLLPPIALAPSGTTLKAIAWAPHRPVLAVLSSPGALQLLTEQPMLAAFHPALAAVQTARRSLAVSRIHGDASSIAPIHISPELTTVMGLTLRDRVLAAWDSERIFIYSVGEDGSCSVVGSFGCLAKAVALHGQSVYLAEAGTGKVEVRTFQGTLKQTLAVGGEEEGEPRLLYTNGSFLLISTTRGYAHIYDLSRREAKATFPPKCLQTGGTDFGSLVSVSLNANGTRLSYVIKSSHGLVDPRLYVYDAEADQSSFFNLTTGASDQAEVEGSAGAEAKSVEARFAAELRGRVPGGHVWDALDPRLVAVQALDASAESNLSAAQIVSFFVTPEHGILVQDAFRPGPSAHRFVGLAIPFFYFTKAEEQEEQESGVAASSVGSGVGGGPSEETLGSSGLVRRVGREFVGLEKAEGSTREAMLNFSFHLTTGNMDEAFKAIKLIKSEAVWENMAEMAVRTERLDVAGVCLGRMGQGRAARMLRLAQRLPASVPSQVKVAALAVQLGRLEEAQRLFQQAGRFDLLNKLHQTRNSWKAALELAGSEDRIHNRNTHYAFAQHLEATGSVDAAIQHYEASETARFEVPRMLFDNPVVLEQYVKKKKDAALGKWWAQYVESLGGLEEACEYYESAGDWLSVVRLACYQGELDRAAAVVRESGDEAAAYHLARHYENAGDFKAAVEFFAKAGAYASAIRLCKDHGLSDSLAHLSLLSSEADMLEAARFYEEQPGQADKAVMLYHKAGMFGRALDLAFRTEQFSALDLIVSDLDASSDPNVLARCAEFFLSNQQYAKAAQLLALAGRHAEAVAACRRHNVALSEELAEQLTPSREAMPDATERTRLLQDLADLCTAQAQYHMAAKKYTQAGMKTEAMRSLLKSGDTEKIVFFANTARSKEIYIMAGNYLQAGDWKSEPERMREILSFYTKGGAPELLAGFYCACADVEIDDYRDYEKGLAALQEAVRCLAKAADSAKDAIQVQERIQALNRSSILIKNFLNIRSVYESDPAEAVTQLTALAAEHNVNEAVRLGDIYAVLVIHNVKKDNYKKAHSYVEELRKKLGRSVDLSRFIKPQILATIYEELNLPPPNSLPSNGQQEHHDAKTVDESIALRRQLTNDEEE